MSLCSEFTALAGCLDVAGVKTSVTIHYEYRTAANGARTLHATRYTDAAGTPIVVGVGDTVTPGACALAAPDVEWEKLCDVDAAGVVTEFFRRSITSFDAAGAATTTTADFELDKVTAYVPAGTVGSCNADCDVIAPVGVVATWG